MGKEKVRILVVDDSPTYRAILRKAMEGINGAHVAGTVDSGKKALEFIEKEDVDLVTLDVVMPGMDGIETLKEIKARKPGIDVVMVSGVEKEAARMTVRALALGAVDFISKPEARNMADAAKALHAQIEKKVEVARYSHKKRRPARSMAPKKGVKTVFRAGKRQRPLQKRVELVLIGVSTGGPNCLSVIIPSLPRDLGVPVLLVQHMPPVFTATMAEHLDKKSKVKVREAVEGDEARPGEVLVAPGGKHMELVATDPSYKVRLADTPPLHGCKPSVDVLFRSVARKAQGRQVLVVILTGMGNDGTQGTQLLKSLTPTYVIAQDEETSVVWGMPGSIVKKGLADEVLPNTSIAQRIAELTKQ